MTLYDFDTSLSDVPFFDCILKHGKKRYVGRLRCRTVGKTEFGRSASATDGRQYRFFRITSSGGSALVSALKVSCGTHPSSKVGLL